MEDYERSLLDGMRMHVPDMYFIGFYCTVFVVIGRFVHSRAITQALKSML